MKHSYYQTNKRRAGTKDNRMSNDESTKASSRKKVTVSRKKPVVESSVLPIDDYMSMLDAEEPVKVEVKQEPQQQDTTPQTLKMFYITGHYWEDTTTPHTIVVAYSVEEAKKMLDDYLQKVCETPETVDVSEFVMRLPISDAGVSVLSIGLGSLGGDYAEKYSNRPIVFPYKSSVNSLDQARLFYCNTHYSSVHTKPASLILAADENEAIIFLRNALKELGVTSFNGVEVKQIPSDTPGVYALCKPLKSDEWYNESYKSPPMKRSIPTTQQKVTPVIRFEEKNNNNNSLDDFDMYS